MPLARRNDWLTVPTPVGPIKMKVPYGEDRARLGRYFNALRRLIERGEMSWAIPGQPGYEPWIIRNAEGREVWLLTDLATLERLIEEDEREWRRSLPDAACEPGWTEAED